MISLIGGIMVKYVMFNEFDNAYNPKLKFRRDCKSCGKKFTADCGRTYYCKICRPSGPYIKKEK